MDILELRNQINRIDQELVSLFCQRMALSGRISNYKKEHGLPIHVPSREAEILQTVEELAGEEMADYAKSLYSHIFELSRSYQRNLSAASSDEVAK